jgi:4'-phosphopantetheinyl transferase
MGTSAPIWLSRRHAEVPPGEDWLGENERAVLASLRFERRRRDWRLGRWAAKCSLATALSVAPERLEVLAAADGAPEPWLDRERLPMSLSISHRAGRAIAVVSDAPQVVGCDLELVEPRSGAFVREWFAPDEQRLLRATPDAQRPQLANLIWSAKEAAAKVRREGLRVDPRRAVVRLLAEPARSGAWRELAVSWADGTPVTTGWWRVGSRWVIVVAGDPSSGPPLAAVRSRARGELGASHHPDG